MKPIIRCLAAAALTLVLLSNVLLPCGPGYITPLFDTTSAPEAPFTDFAAGRLGIVKPAYHRSVLIAAYRHIVGNGLTEAEQTALIEVWNSEFKNKEFVDDSIDDAVKLWIDTRKKAELKEEKPPEIYTERSYGGYDFFPNCAKNAFETAAETLNDRLRAHGPSDPNLHDWVRGQDKVFVNCSSGKQIPDEPTIGAPQWLQKDRAYQKAAAEFYSMNYNTAGKLFVEIAQDTESPWQETAAYLVIRTLIRQASLTKDKNKADDLYDEAEIKLRNFVGSGKYSASAERMMGLIAYRRHPRERVSELAKRISYVGGNSNFRQDVIDYTWLLDKFELELLSAEEKRKVEEELKKRPANLNTAATNTTTYSPDLFASNTANAAVANAVASAANAVSSSNLNSNSYRRVTSSRQNDDDMEINLYLDNGSFTFFLPADATDSQAIAEAERLVGKPLSDDQKGQVKALRQGAYSGRFTNNAGSGYEGGYWGEEALKPGLVPDFLRQDDLTDWLYTYQMPGSAETYLYSLERWKGGRSDLWLMTALAKADKSSADLVRLLEAAGKVTRLSPAYPTIAYHHARVLIALDRSAEARRVIEDALELGDRLPISAQNSFFSLKLKFAQTMDEYLTLSLRKPFAFDFDGSVGTIEQFIAEQKTWYDPEYNKDGREAYDREIEDRYKLERLWQDRLMFDSDTIEVFNQHLPTQQLIEVSRSPVLPEYLRERFVMAAWARSFLLDDLVTLLKLTPEVLKHHPELEEELKPLLNARTLNTQDQAILYFVLKHPVITPYLEDGMGRLDDEQEEWSADDWWCEPYDSEYNSATESEQPRTLPPRPPFLTAAQTKQAQTERRKLKATGDAPKYLAGKVLAWAKRLPVDKRVPEALYIVIQANGWNKYGCGNNEELREELSTHLKRRYPSNPWTKKLIEEESQR